MTITNHLRAKVLCIFQIEWYALIIHSRGYIGERMHPIVVCLHNAVPFFSFDYYGLKYRSLPTLKKKVKLESSKTFLIIHDAGLTSNMYTYLSDRPMPKADEVVDLVLNFDRTACGAFSREKQECFEKSINKALSMLNT